MENSVAKPVQIRPKKSWPIPNLNELYSYRSMLLYFVKRDIQVRYSQTFLGILWAIIQPTFTTLIFTFVFGRLAKISSDGLPYPLFALAALVPWTFFSTSLKTTSGSILTNARLIEKVYFPRLIIPISTVIASLVDYGISFSVLLVLLFSFGYVPSVQAILLIPLLTIILMMAVLGIGMWIAALSILYRDLRHILPFAIQGLMFASPIVYPLSLVPEKYRELYMLNPMAGIIRGFRNLLLENAQNFPWIDIAKTSVIALLLLVSGALYFRRVEQTLADVL